MTFSQVGIMYFNGILSYYLVFFLDIFIHEYCICNVSTSPAPPMSPSLIPIQCDDVFCSLITVVHIHTHTHTLSTFDVVKVHMFVELTTSDKITI